jgi:hypothetical protein
MWQLALGLGLAGAGMGALSTFFQGQKAQDQLQKQKDLSWEKYLLGKEYSDQQYSINRSDAQTSLAIQRGRLDQNFDMGIDQFNTGLLAQAYGIQNAQIQTASNIGASLAAEGMSGTRGNGANDLMRAYEQENLDRSVDLQYRQNDQALEGMVTQANNGLADIDRERASWDPGGSRYASKEAQDEYNRKMAELERDSYDDAISAATPGWEDYLVSAFGGASSGLSLAGSINSFASVNGAGTKAGAGTSSAGSSNPAAYLPSISLSDSLEFSSPEDLGWSMPSLSPLTLPLPDTSLNFPAFNTLGRPNSFSDLGKWRL